MLLQKTMTNKRQKIKESEELSNNPKLQEALADADKYQALLALENLEGGKILLNALKSDAVGDFNALIVGYKTLTHLDLLALLASLDSKIQILRLISHARTNLEGAEAFIDELVK